MSATRLQWDDCAACLISVAASKAQAGYIITRDTKGFARSSVPFISPEEWLASMQGQGLTYAEVAL